jgi:nucleotide-binding universal stress UspA family protein
MAIAGKGFRQMLPQKILFCTDFSDNSKPARQNAVDYARAFGAELIILHVINSSRIGYPSLDEGLPLDIRSTLTNIQQSVQKALSLMASECSKDLQRVQTSVLVGTPAEEIVRFSEQESVQLVVMGTHGWTGFKHLIMGSTAENVVRTSLCPVLTVKSSSS